VCEPINSAPLARNQLAQAVLILIRVLVELPPECRRLVIVEHPKGIKITILFVKLPLFRAEHHGVYSLDQKRPDQPCQLVRLGQKRIVAVRGNQLSVLAADPRLHHARGQCGYIGRRK
jgi:hypothetical protein